MPTAPPTSDSSTLSVSTSRTIRPVLPREIGREGHDDIDGDDEIPIRHDADDGVRDVVDDDRLADDGCVPAQPCAPDGFRQDGDPGPAGLILVRGEGAAGNRL